MTDLGLDNSLVLQGIAGASQQTVVPLMAQLVEVPQKIMRVESHKDEMEARLADVLETLASQQHRFEACVADLCARFDVRLETALCETVEVTQSRLDKQQTQKLNST